MVKNNKMLYRIGNLNNTVIFGKERMNVNEVKHFTVNNNVNEKYDDNEMGM